MNITISDVEEAVCRIFKINRSDLYIKTKETRICLPRQVSMAFLMTKLELDSLSVAMHYFLSSHATALHALKKVNKKCDEDPAFKSKYDAVKSILFEITKINDFEVQDVNLLKLTIQNDRKTNYEKQYIIGIV